MSRYSSIGAVVAFAVTALGCGSDPVDGQAVYSQPVLAGNTFACQTCHALDEPAEDGIRRPGHAIGDATRRSSYKNGQFTDMLDAVNTCLVEWMLAPPWQEDDEEWIALHDFLDSRVQTAAADPIAIDIVQPPADLAGGDAASGQELFNSSCVVCHGMNAVGTERAPPLLGSLLEPAYIAQRIRTSGLTDSSTYDGLTGGRMPFWGADRLSDDELRDVVAFVDQNEPDITQPGNGSDGPAARECDATHPRVGQTAEFRTLAHGVRGTARIVDDCHIEIENFFYDGNGIDVRVYSGQGGNYSGGVAMTGDLLKRGGYQNESITATLPEGTTLDDLDGISIWCVDVGVNFGDARFADL